MCMNVANVGVVVPVRVSVCMCVCVLSQKSFLAHGKGQGRNIIFPNNENLFLIECVEGNGLLAGWMFLRRVSQLKDIAGTR